MSITDELREYASTRISPNKGLLLAIADRIDAEHERLMQEQPFTIDMVPMTDERMAEGWQRVRACRPVPPSHSAAMSILREYCNDGRSAD